ncbi:M56 family metallopeptidase [Sphingobacterium sp. HJSM2_6]|uniref:M56 family metallopeptidase n=1 Tax=Sphingobacterium sp. HJSM2_6 TaxID=3366264 RepID=UPI003BCDFC35
MESIITYILQVNLLLGLLYLGYNFLLKNLTFYTLNRYYFILGSIYAFLYPFIAFQHLFNQQILPQIQGELINFLPIIVEEEGKTFSIGDGLLGLFSFIAILFLIKLIFQLISLYRIYHYSKPAQWQAYYFRNVIFPITPFSFFNKIYLHQDQHEEPELNDIFKHEYIHVKGHHSLDVLWFELVLIVCWYNPFVWFMRKAVRQNLEFLTDQQVLDKGVDRQTYQYSLLQVSKQGVRVGLSNHFNFNILKKRIMMMNKKRSSKMELGKYAFLLPIMIMAGITFTVNQAEAKIESVAVKAVHTDFQEIKKVVIQDTTKKVKITVKEDAKNKLEAIPLGEKIFVDDKEMPEEFELDKLDAKTIESVNVFKSSNDASDKGTIKVYTKSFEGIPVRVEASDADTTKKLKGKVVGIKSEKVSAGEMQVSVKSSGENPLILVDGVKKDVADLKALSPDLIESISILKGDSVTAVFGDKAKHGVMFIETKGNNRTSTRKDSADLTNVKRLDEVVVIGYGRKNTTNEVVGAGMKKEDQVDVQAQEKPAARITVRGTPAKEVSATRITVRGTESKK